MQLRRTGAGVAIAASATCVPAGAAPASDALYLFRYFADSDDVHVLSHWGAYDVELENGATAAIHWNRETVLIPAIDAPAGSPEAVDAITTASRPIANAADAFRDYAKVRNEVEGGVSMSGARLGYYVSTESDYFAQQLAAGYARDFFGRNLNLSVGTSYGWDAIEPLADDDTDTGREKRTTLHVNVVATQVLGPRTLLRAGVEVNVVRGLQHSPYRNVYAGGGNVPERHPTERLRRDAFVKLSQYFGNRTSVRLDYRLYDDDWGIRSHALGARLHQYVGELVVVRHRYRYYTQTAAGFHSDEYASEEGVDGYRTADYRLAPLTSHLFGTRVEVPLGTFADRPLLRRFRFSISYERYFNSNNFSANVFETSLGYSF